MPTYEYQCGACGHQLEVFQKMSDDPLANCPKCQKPALTKQISAAGFQLKGSGWYVTDYSKKGKAKAADSAANSTESNGGGEAKPVAAKTDTKSTNSSPKTSSSDKSGESK